MRNSVNTLIGRLLGTVALVLFAHAAAAAPVVNPAGLNPGDPYRLVFTTSTLRDAASGNIADYNAFVTGVAAGIPELVALGTTWSAIASTTTVSARMNTGTLGGALIPVFNLNGEKVAGSYADLWDGALDATLKYDETGGLLNSSVSNRVWSGTTISGAIKAGDELGTATPGLGKDNVTNSGWIELNESVPQSNGRHLYGMSATLTAVPLPPAVVFLTLPLLALLRASINGDRPRFKTGPVRQILPSSHGFPG